MSRSMPHVVCMLAEGGYFHGVAALCNSLARNGFDGEIVVGYRGDLPKWDGPISPVRDRRLPLTGDIGVRFIPVCDDRPSSWSLTNLKPRFLRHVADVVHRDFASLWYFDADIVIKTHWSNFARWSHAGIVLVLDLAETYMPANHLFRRAWRDLAARDGRSGRDVVGYFNAGCVGLAQDGLPLIDAWASLLDRRAAEGAQMAFRTDRHGEPEFAKGDQDILNAAVMACDLPYAVLGVEAMDAFPSAEIMSHAMVFAKPWQRRYVRDAVKGYPPDAAHRAFWEYADGPIRSFTPAEWRRRYSGFRIGHGLRHLKRQRVGDW